MSTAVPFLDLQAPYRELAGEIDQAMQRVAASGWYLLGEELAAFERAFAAHVGAAHCVGVANGLDALQLALLASGVGPGDEVIVPANTFIATWFAATMIGAVPVAVEPDLATYNVDPERIEAAITPRTRAIAPVHLYGLPADLAAICEIGARRGIPVIADAAQAHGARYHSMPVGAFGHAAAWSFYPGKNLGALGDGGAVTTSDASIADRIRVLRNYGSRTKYVHEERGINSRLDDLQAAILGVKLARLDEWNGRRKRLAARYHAALRDLPIDLPVEPGGLESAWHLYVIRVRDREALRAQLSAAGIATLIHYPIPPYRQGAYQEFQQPRGAFPITDRIHDEVLSLPIGPHLSDDQQDRVIAAIAGHFANERSLR